MLEVHGDRNALKNTRKYFFSDASHIAECIFFLRNVLFICTSCAMYGHRSGMGGWGVSQSLGIQNNNLLLNERVYEVYWSEVRAQRNEASSIARVS